MNVFIKYIWYINIKKKIGIIYVIYMLKLLIYMFCLSFVIKLKKKIVLYGIFIFIFIV